MTKMKKSTKVFLVILWMVAGVLVGAVIANRYGWLSPINILVQCIFASSISFLIYVYRLRQVYAEDEEKYQKLVRRLRWQFPIGVGIAIVVCIVLAIFVLK
ncbi:MAG: hypothetical protein FWD76_01685 [Firmicutes bacterium]|nr:hypothetical protein [Bacillota bacterium]